MMDFCLKFLIDSEKLKIPVTLEYDSFTISDTEFCVPKNIQFLESLNSLPIAPPKKIVKHFDNVKLKLTTDGKVILKTRTSKVCLPKTTISWHDDTKPFVHLFEMEVHDSYGYTFPATQVPHVFLPMEVIPGSDYIYNLNWRDVNFTISDQVSDNNNDGNLLGMPSGGFLTTFANPLPLKYRPEQEKSWIVPSANAYLLNFSYLNPNPPNRTFTATSTTNSAVLTNVSNLNGLYVGQTINDANQATTPFGGVQIVSIDYINLTITVSLPLYLDTSTTFIAQVFPKPGAGFMLTLNPYGILSLFQNDRFAMTIPPGPHTLANSTIPVAYDWRRLELCLEPADNFIIEKRFTDISQFTGTDLDDGVRDTHKHDSYRGIIAVSWSGNPNWVQQGQQSNGVMDLYVRIGRIKASGKIKWGSVQQLTQYQPSSYPGYSTQAWDTSIAINRLNEKYIAVSWNELNYVTGTYTPYVRISSDIGETWGNPINVAADLIIPEVQGPGDCLGVAADIYGNFIFSMNLENYAPATGIFTVEPCLLGSGDFGQTWTLFYMSNISTTYEGGGLYQFDYPQMTFGTLDGVQYGAYLAADFGSFLSLNIDTVPYLGFAPIYGLGQFASQNQVTFGPLNISNNVEHACLTSVPDGTLYIIYQKNLDNEFATNGNTSSVSSHLILIKPPGAIDPTTIIGPYTAFQHVNDYFKPTASYPYPGFAFFTQTIRSFYYDLTRDAHYVVINNPPTWYVPKTGSEIISQNFETFMIISVDKCTSWSRKFPVASTIRNNRGFMDMIPVDHKGKTSLFFGDYDARNSPDSTQLQFFGAYLSAEKLDYWVDISRKEAGR